MVALTGSPLAFRFAAPGLRRRATSSADVLGDGKASLPFCMLFIPRNVLALNAIASYCVLALTPLIAKALVLAKGWSWRWA